MFKNTMQQQENVIKTDLQKQEHDKERWLNKYIKSIVYISWVKI